jgi:hypothetical protein
VSSIPSVQVNADGRPRFHLPAPADAAGWAEAVTAEANGGVAADIRIFLDAQLGDGDVLVDLDPGFGFVALSAATAPGGLPTVLVRSADAARLAQWQAAADDVAAIVDAAPADPGALVALVTQRLDEQGRLFVHLGAADTASTLTAFRAQVESGQLVALCIGDAHESPSWLAAGQALANAGYVACGIVERQGQAVLTPQGDRPTAPVIALPAELINAS